ncbi:pseudouridine synthase [Gallicola sp. Sow4_E12]|uniref:pseudouridine synthase n=1 Tax=Gallicola sp. Sow4_E12 TaxID=3438785 RepID=UPI003F8D9553
MKKLRIDKILANLGYGTRSSIKKEMKKGVVTVNDKVVKDSSTLIDPEKDELYYKDLLIEYQEYIYLVMNKPAGIISATEDYNQETVVDILIPEDQARDPFPVGRLDIDTEGLLLLTNDGKFAHKISSPKSEIPKTYFVKTKEKIEEKLIKKFKKGIYLINEDITTKPAELEILSDHTAHLTIYEGKFHQVKRMFEYTGNEVLFLKRIKIGAFSLPEDLEPGEYKEMDLEDLEKEIGI